MKEGSKLHYDYEAALWNHCSPFSHDITTVFSAAAGDIANPSGRAHRGNSGEASGEVPSSIQERLQVMENPNLQLPIRQGPPSSTFIRQGSNPTIGLF